MQLNVAKIREPFQRIERTDEAQAFAVEDAYRVVSPVYLAFDVRKDKDKVHLYGRLQTVIELACSRCLEGFAIPVDTPFDLRFLPAADAPGPEAEHEIEEDDLGTSYYRDGVIDLADLVREQLYLALPMKPLCQELCHGLCPQCGTNLNSGACSCVNGWEDPRLAPLKALARKNNDA